MSTRAVETWTLDPLKHFVDEASARLVLLMTPAGQVMAQHGFSRAVDVMSAAALGAAIMASTAEIARQLTQPPFAAITVGRAPRHLSRRRGHEPRDDRRAGCVRPGRFVRRLGAAIL
jgi:hypothetical protein